MEEKRARLAAVDELRGLAMVLVLVYHFLYQLWAFGYAGNPQDGWTVVIGRTGAVLFFVISGFSARLSHNLLRRSLITLGAAVLVWAATYFTDFTDPIVFGVLHCLGFCGLLTALLGGFAEKFPPLFGLAGSAALFVLLSGVPEGRFFQYALPAALYRSPYLFWLGFPADGFASGDYYPLLPWIFAYLCGFYLYAALRSRGMPVALSQKHLPALAWMGRHTLWIYLLHQPVYIAAFLLVGTLFSV